MRMLIFISFIIKLLKLRLDENKSMLTTEKNAEVKLQALLKYTVWYIYINIKLIP
jgi:hypothetical protein